MSSKLFVILALLCISCIFSKSYNTFGSEDVLAIDLNRINFINESQNDWVAGVNTKFEQATVKEVKYLLGTFLTSHEELRKKVPFIEVEELQGLPEEYDARVQYPNCESIKEIRDQSTCGSCWAFSAAEVMSDRICIHSNQTLQTRVSPQQLVSCCKDCGHGCNGGWPLKAFNYWGQTGIVTGGLYGQYAQTCMPYVFPPCDHHVDGKYGPCGSSKPTPECSLRCNSSYNVPFLQDKTYGTSYGVPKKETSIQQEIVSHGPVSAAFMVYDDFLTYKSGVYRKTKGAKQLGGHAVKIIGYGVENGTKYWLVVNSWNEGWGDKGLFKIARGGNECGIEEEIVAGVPSDKKVSLKFLDN
jgi:cathepsin B